jgi:hypothetical protein
MERANSGTSWMIAYQLWTDQGERQRALIALTKSGQTGYVPALRALIAMALPLCDSLLLHASVESAVMDVIDEDDSTSANGEKLQQYQNKLMSDVTSLLEINLSDKAALDICKTQSSALCEQELKKKVIKWLRKAVTMGCEESQSDLDALEQQ